MTRAVVSLILVAWLAAAEAQLFRRGPTDEQLRQMQQQGQSFQMPSREEMEQMQRDAAEMQRLQKDLERAQRLGRFDEAQAIAKRLDELMNSGATGRMMQQQRGRMGDVMRMLPEGALPDGITAEDLESMQRFSVSDTLGMERRLMEGDGPFLPEPLFVRPVLLRYSPEMNRQSVRMPMKARELLMEGYTRMNAKDYDGAEAAFKQAAALTPSSQVLEAQARLHWVRGNPKTALRLMETFSQKNVSLLWLQAEIQSALGNHRAAIDAAQQALKVAAAGGETSGEYASALNNLGVQLQLGGEPKRALELYEKSVGVLQAGMQAAQAQTAQILRIQIPTVAANLGLAFWQLGDSARAAEAYRVALDERAFHENANQAFMTERAQLAKAQATVVELDALLSLDSTLGLQTLLERKGALLERRTRTQSAFRRDANAQIDQPGALGRMFESPMTRVQREQQVRQQAQDQDLLREYEAAVTERAMLAGKGSPSAEDAKNMADLDLRIQVMQQRMQMRELENKNRVDVAATRDDMTDLARQYRNDPAKMMQAMNARMGQQQRVREQTASAARASLPSRVQERVPPGAVLLEMVKYRPIDPKDPDAKRAERYGTYVIKAGAAPEYVDLGEAAPLEKLIAQYRAALATPDRPAKDLGRQLDQVLMRPVRARLGSATTLYVAPEGAVNLAPLSALVDEEGRYLMERYTINYLASGRDLLYLGHAEPARSPALIIADPAFDKVGIAPAQAGGQAGTQTRSRDFRSTRYERLPGTAAEAATLQKVLTDAKLLTGTAATETAAKKVAGPRILHIATHGFFLDDLPGQSEDPMLRSGLVFAGVNALSSAEDDGVLTALEASSLDLRGTKLVVLSACETGVGEVRNGEGVFGLRRAFVVAGAETLLMSLWQVADEATKDLMTAYYSRLAKGEARAEALRQAQLGMLQDPKTAHPFFWAAFISSGESGTLR